MVFIIRFFNQFIIFIPIHVMWNSNREIFFLRDISTFRNHAFEKALVWRSSSQRRRAQLYFFNRKRAYVPSYNKIEKDGINGE